MPFQNFRPLPMRITHKQYERLQLAREYDHLAIQEHVRRALDFYLDDLERHQGRGTSPAPPPAPPPVRQPTIDEANASLEKARARSSKRKLVYR